MDIINHCITVHMYHFLNNVVIHCEYVHAQHIVEEEVGVGHGEYLPPAAAGSKVKRRAPSMTFAADAGPSQRTKVTT